jgi:hypothetical protein
VSLQDLTARQGVSMSAPIRKHDNPAAHEREIRSLSVSSGTSPAEVRALFMPELARLKIGAKVGSYLAVLTQSNVRGMLRRKARLAAASTLALTVSEIAVVQRARSPRHVRTLQSDLTRWQDDGGAPRRRIAPSPGRAKP